MRLAAVLLAGLALSGCATDPAKLLGAYTEAANTLDPDCGKKIHLDLRQREIVGWPLAVPEITGTYDKVCHPEMFLDEATKAAIRAEVEAALEDFTDPK